MKKLMNIMKEKLNGLEKENESEVKKEVKEIENIERYCKSCGRELENDSKYCFNCSNKPKWCWK